MQHLLLLLLQKSNLFHDDDLYDLTATATDRPNRPTTTRITQ